MEGISPFPAQYPVGPQTVRVRACISRDGAKDVPSHLDPTSPDYIGPQLGPAAQLLLQGGAKKTHNPFVRSVSRSAYS